MNLLLDIGNTRIKWAFESEGELHLAGELVHRNKSAAEVVQFVDLLQSTPEAAVAVNVAGQETGRLVADSLMQRYGCALRFVETTARVGPVRNGYSAIEQLGTDRWAALVAAWYRHSQAVCVVDAGSALTIDLVGSSGRHYGGVILPGLALMQDALKVDTSDIAGFASRHQPQAESGDWYGHDTATALECGSLLAAVSAIEAAVAKFPEPNVTPRLVLTGGDAPILLSRLAAPTEHQPLLVLEGLLRLGEEND